MDFTPSVLAREVGEAVEAHAYAAASRRLGQHIHPSIARFDARSVEENDVSGIDAVWKMAGKLLLQLIDELAEMTVKVAVSGVRDETQTHGQIRKRRLERLAGSNPHRN